MDQTQARFNNLSAFPRHIRLSPEEANYLVNARSGLVTSHIYYAVSQSKSDLCICKVDELESSGRPRRQQTISGFEPTSFGSFPHLSYVAPSVLIKDQRCKSLAKAIPSRFPFFHSRRGEGFSKFQGDHNQLFSLLVDSKNLI